MPVGTTQFATEAPMTQLGRAAASGQSVDHVRFASFPSSVSTDASWHQPVWTGQLIQDETPYRSPRFSHGSCSFFSFSVFYFNRCHWVPPNAGVPFAGCASTDASSYHPTRISQSIQDESPHRSPNDATRKRRCSRPNR